MNSSPNPNKPDDSDGCPGRLNELQDLQKQLSKIADSVEPASTSPGLAEQVERRQRRQLVQQKVGTAAAATAVAASLVGAFVVLQPPLVSSMSSAPEGNHSTQQTTEVASAEKDSGRASGKKDLPMSASGPVDKEAATGSGPKRQDSLATPASPNSSSQEGVPRPAPGDAIGVDATHFLFPTPGESARRRAKVMAFMTWSAARECNIDVSASLRDALVSTGQWSRDSSLDAELGFGGSREALKFWQGLSHDESLCITQKRTKIFGTVDTAESHRELINQRLVGNRFVKQHQQKALHCISGRTKNGASPGGRESFEKQVINLFDGYVPKNRQGQQDEVARRTFGAIYHSCTKTYFNRINELISDEVASLSGSKTTEINNLAQTLRQQGYQAQIGQHR